MRIARGVIVTLLWMTVIWATVIGAFLLVRAVAHAQTHNVDGVTMLAFPCDPVPILTLQGRPIPNANVSVANPDNSQVAGGVWFDYGKTMPFTGTLPANAENLLQFYAAEGVYTVSVSGAGVTKTYLTRCGIGVGTAVKLISVSFNASQMGTQSLAPAATFACIPGGQCVMEFPALSDAAVILELVTPSFPTTFGSIFLEFEAATAPVSNFLAWELGSCVIPAGAPAAACLPEMNNLIEVSAPITSMPETVTNFTLGPPAWNILLQPDSHVLVSIKSKPGFDNSGAIRALEAARLELVRQ